MKNFLYLVAHTVDFVLTLAKRELPIALDVKQTKDINFGVNVSCMLVLRIMKLGTVDCAKVFHVICFKVNLIHGMGRKVLL